jgi:hypothetical protein
LPPPSSHTTVRRVPYTAVPAGLRFAVLNACRPLKRPALSRGFRPLPPAWARSRGICSRRSENRSSFSDRFSPSPVGPATAASADFCHPIPTPRGAGSTRQDGRSPRVRRVTFVPSTCRIYGRTLRGASGFELFGPLARVRTPHMRWLFVRPALCLQLPSDPGSLRAPLLFG